MKMGFFKKGERKQHGQHTGKAGHSESTNGAIRTSAGTVDDTEHKNRRGKFRTVVMKTFSRRRRSKSRQRRNTKQEQQEGQHPDKNGTEEKREDQHFLPEEMRAVPSSPSAPADLPIERQQNAKALHGSKIPEARKVAVQHVNLQDDAKALRDSEMPEGREEVGHVGGNSGKPTLKTGKAWGYMSSRSIQHVDIHGAHIISRLRESEGCKEGRLLRRLSAPSTMDTRASMGEKANSSSEPQEYSHLRRRSFESGLSSSIGSSNHHRCRRSSKSLKGQPGAINRTDFVDPLTLFSPKGIPVPYAPHFGEAKSSGFELVGGYFAQEPSGNGYGSFMLMRNVDNEVVYTVKVFDRYSMDEEDLETQQKAAESIVSERHVLESHSNPYIMSTFASFQDSKNLYLVLDFEGGESLASCLNREGRFNEAASLLLVAELVDATVHLHGMGIAHRSISCDAVLVDKWGHVCLTDLGNVKFKSAPTHGFITVCGQDPYTAPEMVFNKKGSGLAADWWSIGVLTTMLLTGKLPLSTVWIHDIEEKLEANLSSISSFVGEHAVDFMRQLMKVNPSERMVESHVVDHSFLSSIDSQRLAEKELVPQYRPLSFSLLHVISMRNTT